MNNKEGQLDKLEMTMKERDEVTNQSKQTIETLKEIIKTIEKITEEGQNSQETMKKAKNELIDEIIKARRKEMEEKIKKKKEEIKEIKNDFEKRKIELDKNRIESEEEKNERKKKGFKEKQEKIGCVKLVTKEEWSGKKCREILFDSDKDDWSVNTSIFDDKIMNKNNLIFIVEDTERISSVD